jgi:hypothetical protein
LADQRRSILQTVWLAFGALQEADGGFMCGLQTRAKQIRDLPLMPFCPSSHSARNRFDDMGITVPPNRVLRQLELARNGARRT